MQIREYKKLNTRKNRVECDSSGCETELTKSLECMEDMPIEDFLDVDVEPGKSGLQVMRIGETSPLCRLRPLGTYSMQGLVESGDRIVAIDGILTHQLSDLSRIASKSRFCEISIFDHRTRLTVTWRIQASNEHEARSFSGWNILFPGENAHLLVWHDICGCFMPPSI